MSCARQSVVCTHISLSDYGRWQFSAANLAKSCCPISFSLSLTCRDSRFELLRNDAALPPRDSVSLRFFGFEESLFFGADDADDEDDDETDAEDDDEDEDEDESYPSLSSSRRWRFFAFFESRFRLSGALFEDDSGFFLDRSGS